MKMGLASAVILMLSGCGTGDSQADNKAAEIAPDVPLKIVITQFPASYFGRWGINEADCVLGVSDAKGLIILQGSLVKFHDSTATMTNGLRETLYAVSGDFDFVAKEEKWRTHTRYRLTKDRKQLTRQDGNDGEKFTYFRCAE